MSKKRSAKKSKQLKPKCPACGMRHFPGECPELKRIREAKHGCPS